MTRTAITCLTQHRGSYALSHTTWGQPCPVSHNTKTCTVPYNTKMTIHCPMQHKDSCAMSHITQRQPCTVPHNTMKTSMCCPTQQNAKSHARSHITRTQPCTDPHNTSQRQSYVVQHNTDSWHSTKRRRVSLKQTCRLAAQWQDSTKPRWNRQRQETHLTAQKEGRWLLTPSQPWQLYQKAHSTLAVQHANKMNKLWRLEQFGDHC